MVASIVGLRIARRLLPVHVLEAANDVVGNYLQTLGSIYAVLLAFVVFVVWNQFNEARAFVEREANEILDLHRTAAGLAEPTRGRVRPAMAGHGPEGAGPGATIIDQMWEAIHDAEPTADGDRSLYREVLKRLDDISDARSSRMTASRTRIPQAMRGLLYAGAVTMVASMYLFAVASFAVHAAITAALAGAISHVLFIVEDLDSCFDGHWQVSRAPFERVRQQTAACAVPASRAGA